MNCSTLEILLWGIVVGTVVSRLAIIIFPSLLKAAIGAAGAALESAAQAILGWRSKAKRGIYFPEPA